MNVVAYAASVGHSVWFSRDRGDHWARAHTTHGGIYNESRAWSIATHPLRPLAPIAGTDEGLFRWDPAHARWLHVPSPMDGEHILQIAWAPHDPDVIFAGTRPAHVYRTTDGGATWMRCALHNAATCEVITTPRVTSIQFDPRDPQTVWVTIEIDAIYRSRDGGTTWERLSRGLLTDDVHNLVIVDELGPRRILVSTEEGLHRSDDDGATFVPVSVSATALVYFRVLAARADRCGVLFLSAGDRPSGEVGELLRSRDWGETWEPIPLDPRPNSTIWSIAVHPADPQLIFFCTIMGQVWRSDDGGETWTKRNRELGELRMLAWEPAVAETLAR